MSRPPFAGRSSGPLRPHQRRFASRMPDSYQSYPPIPQRRRPQPPRRSRSWLGVGVTVLVLVRLLGCAGVLAVRFTSTVFQLLGGAPASETPESGAATATLPPTPDWRIAYFAGGTFRIEVPGVLVSSHGYFADAGYGQGSDFVYAEASTSSPFQQLAAAASFSVQ